MILLVKLLSRLPFWALYGISDVLYFLSYRVVGYRRAVVKGNLQRSFPEKSPEEIASITKEFYHNLCDVVVEVVKIYSLTAEELVNRTKFNNLEILDQFKGKAAMFMSTHNFSWEWIMLSACLQFPFEIDYVYQKLQDPKFDNFIKSLRSKFGGHGVEMKTAAREIMRRSKDGRGFGMAADQMPWKHSKKYWTTFLGQESAFYLGSDMLAKLTQCPVLFFAIKKTKRGYYEVDIKILCLPPHEKSSNEIMEKYVAATEELIKSQPANYLWSHKRWKYTREQHP
jgi:KDO2-lipid IV(A) lauroyltransferase